MLKLDLNIKIILLTCQFMLVTHAQASTQFLAKTGSFLLKGFFYVIINYSCV